MTRRAVVRPRVRPVRFRLRADDRCVQELVGFHLKRDRDDQERGTQGQRLAGAVFLRAHGGDGLAERGRGNGRRRQQVFAVGVEERLAVLEVRRAGEQAVDEVGDGALGCLPILRGISVNWFRSLLMTA